MASADMSRRIGNRPQLAVDAHHRLQSCLDVDVGALCLHRNDENLVQFH